jgi:DNA topoisomerase-1
MISDFYKPFHKTIEASADISRKDATQTRELGNDPKTGKPIFARVGRYGPMLQLGETESEEKPKFAPIPKGKKFDKITLEEALPFFDLPRHIGDSPDGYKVVSQIGRFGPYVRCNKTFASITDDELFTITLDEALLKIKEKEEKKSKMEIKTFDGSDVKVLDGRFGPYITDGKKNVKIPKDTKPESLTLEECVELIDKAPAKKKRASSRKK